MTGLNKVMLIGTVGRDPEMRYTPDGVAVTSFSLAVKRVWKGSDGKSQEAWDWFSVIAWRRLAEICKQYLARGEHVYVEGRLQTREWQDETGQNHLRTEVVASHILLLDKSLPGDAVALSGDEDPSFV